MAYIFIKGVPTGFQVYESAKDVETAIGWQDSPARKVATFRTVEGNVIRVLSEDIRVVVDE